MMLGLMPPVLSAGSAGESWSHERPEQALKRILVISGSRADYGLLEWPIKKLQEDGSFDVTVHKMWGRGFAEANLECQNLVANYDLLLVLGDRFEILAAAT